MYVDGDFFAYSLEDVYRGQLENEADKVYGETAIPCGTYAVIVDYSNAFKKELPHILQVNKFDGVRIHGGNTAKDSLGCILIGKNTNWIDTISDCKERVETLTKMIKEASAATIEIVNNVNV